MRITYLFIVLSLMALSSCGAIIKSYIRKDDENIPAEFGKEKTTLLVLKQRKGYNKKVEKIIKKHYSGEYGFVSKEGLNNKPYDDTIMYRYLLNDNISISRGSIGSTVSAGPRAGQPAQQLVSSGSRSFRVIDRKMKKVYDTGVSSGVSWKTVLRAYLKKLEKERKKNSGI